jgi:hypothetical protein
MQPNNSTPLCTKFNKQINETKCFLEHKFIKFRYLVFCELCLIEEQIQTLNNEQNKLADKV